VNRLKTKKNSKLSGLKITLGESCENLKGLLGRCGRQRMVSQTQGIKEKLVSENNFMNIYLIANIEPYSLEAQ
jgi:hypothetical protein